MTVYSTVASTNIIPRLSRYLPRALKYLRLNCNFPWADDPLGGSGSIGVLLAYISGDTSFTLVAG